MVKKWSLLVVLLYDCSTTCIWPMTRTAALSYSQVHQQDPYLALSAVGQGLEAAKEAEKQAA